MCGIFGYYSLNQEKADRQLFNKSLLTIIHRGPEFQQSKYFNDDLIALGHVRLSIIDLTDSANQPMALGKYNIVFNGEIYNYIELREELKQKGYSFTTNSDTEVLVQSFDYWGEECVSHFNGMWSFAILNEEDNSLFCSRDRYGVKPFNYYIDNNKLIFASEIKPIISYDTSLKVPNYNSISLFCREGICGEIPETWFDNIYRLLPGHNLVLKEGKITIRKYYNYTSKTKNLNFEQAKKEFYDLFIDSVKIRMRSDVPVGTTLSGGLDSSSIVAALRTFYSGSHDTFTAHFPGFKDDEFVTASKTNHYYNLNGNPVFIDYKDAYIDVLQKIIYHLESGHLSPSIFPLWKVYEQAKKKVTVVLEGQGADELMAGYIASFAGAFIKEKLSRFQLKKAIRIFLLLKKNYSLATILKLYLRTTLPGFVRTFIRRYILKYENVFKGHLKNWRYTYKPYLKSDSKFKQILQNSHQTTLVNLLHYGDAISMAFSIESRLPFMDYRLVDFSFSLPDDFFISQGKGKYILRESLKNILPEHINNDNRKLGFPSPINTYLDNNKKLIKRILLSPKAISRNIFDENKLDKFIHSKLDTSLNSGRFIFRLICVELWFSIFIDNEN
jgi:asparagine synthase (glutamine-hydrolysing)